MFLHKNISCFILTKLEKGENEGLSYAYQKKSYTLTACDEATDCPNNSVVHTKLQLKAFLLHHNLIYNLYGNTLPAVISFMLLSSNYYNIGSESYFLNGPLFNYKLILNYSYLKLILLGNIKVYCSAACVICDPI